MTSKKNSSTISITLKKSLVGEKQPKRDTAKALGLRRIRQIVIKPDTPAVRGMISKINHLVEIKTN